MSSLNKVILIGRLTKDPVLRMAAGGMPVTTFTIAVDRRPNAQGVKEADFVPVVTFKKVAENVANILTKGRLVAVEGRLQIRDFMTQSGEKRRSAEVLANTVQFLDRATGTKEGYSAPSPQDSMTKESHPQNTGAGDGTDIDLGDTFTELE